MDVSNKIIDYNSNEDPIEISSTTLVTYNFHSRLLKKFHKPVRHTFRRMTNCLSDDNDSKVDVSHDAVISQLKDESRLDLLHNEKNIINEQHVINVNKPSIPSASLMKVDYTVPDFNSFVSLLFQPKNDLDYFDHENFIDINCMKDVYTSSNILSDVIERESEENLNPPLKCSVCNNSSCRHLKILENSHNREAAYVCGECSYTCRKLSNLRSHKQIHNQDKQFACDKCDYTSNFINNLKSHKIIHSGEKPFSCTECDYVCGRPSNLKRHKLKHSKEKPYPCDVCNYMSKDLTGLKVHKLTHSGEKPFACDECSSSYITLKSLNHHKKKHTLKSAS